MNYTKILLIIFLITIVGSAMAEEVQTIPPAQMTKEDLIKLSQFGVSDEIIINQTKATNTFFKLTTNEILELKQAGVSNNVINFILQAGTYTPPPRGILLSTPAPVVTTGIYISPYSYPYPWYDPWYPYWGWGSPGYGPWYGGRYYYHGHHGKHHGGHHGGGHGGGDNGGGGHGGHH